MKKHKITEHDYLKANRKASREEEIEMHGKPIRRPAVHQSKKTYNRKRMKAGSKILPLSYVISGLNSAGITRTGLRCVLQVLANLRAKGEYDFTIGVAIAPDVDVTKTVRYIAD